MTTKNNPSGFGWSQGQVAPQAHVDVPHGLYEEEHGRRGFFGRVSHLYHEHPPTGWLRVEGEGIPRAYRASEIKGEKEGQPQVFLQNRSVQIGMARVKGAMNIFFRNGDGDELRFVHEGSGTLQTEYGEMSYRKGDYLVIPRGTTFRFVADKPTQFLTVEATGSEYELPDRGMLGRHAQFDPMILRVPSLTGTGKKTGTASAKQDAKTKMDGKNKKGEYEVWIKRLGAITKVFYPFHPFNLKGWKGDLCPWAINVEDIRPIICPRYHLPPSVHTTFVAQGFVVCSFLPRPLESEPGAMKVPFYHRNIDFDEVLFYHSGNFFSREGIGAGAVTWHPIGIHHGPHPNAAKNVENKVNTEEVAVMIDTREPLEATGFAKKVEIKDYVMSWRLDQKR